MGSKIIKKFTVFIIIFGLFTSFTYADELTDLKDSINKTIQTLIQKYEDQIKVLQDENNKLKQDVERLTKQSGGSTTTVNNVSTSTTGTVSTSSNNISDNAKYNSIIQRIKNISEDIFKDNNLDETSSIGLFEFIEPNNFFISIDDGKNPAGVTAFKTKILYSYDTNYNFTIKGIFSFDSKVSLYKTIFGSNPFAGVTRIRLKNPEYKGKLLEEQSTTSTVSPSTSNSITNSSTTPKNTTTSSVITGVKNVTLNDIKQAYNKNKILDVLKLSDEYIKTDSNNIEVLKMRYRSYYILGKYSNSITEIQKIGSIQGDNIEKIIACDASVIAKMAKNTELSTKYKEICNKK